MNAYKVPLAHNNYGEEELLAAERVLRSGYLTQGPRVEEFENALAARFGVRHAIFVNSGSSANLIAIEAAIYCSGLKPEITSGPVCAGDEAILPGLNWPSTLKPIVNHNLVPVFCDIDPNSLNASVETVEAVRTKKTRVVVAVPVLGNPTGLDELRAYCADESLILIEDACESLGAVTPSGQWVGALGLCSALSFYFSHHISTIEGGAILTDSAEIADLCFALRSHGWTRHLKLGKFEFEQAEDRIDPRFCFALPGYNVRSTEIAAVLGRTQLYRLDSMLAARRRIAAARHQALRDCGDLISIPGANIGDRHSWMTTPLLFRDGALRRKAQISLEGAGIETRPIIVGNILRHPIAKTLGLKESQPTLPVCDEVFDRGIMIGLNPFSPAETEDFVHAALRHSVGIEGN